MTNKFSRAFMIMYAISFMFDVVILILVIIFIGRCYAWASEIRQEPENQSEQNV